jgi:hypothetical protein
MNNGFKVQSLHSKERALQIIKSSYFLKDGRHRQSVADNRREHYWNNFGSEQDKPCSHDELFIPCDDRFIPSLDLTTTPGRQPIYTLFNKSKGFWKLRVIRSSVNDLTDFTISVLVGNKWRYYPAAIKREIVHHHGLELYQQWRSTVLNDVDGLRQLINSVRFKGYAYSVTCCDPSERLCKLAGLEVQSNIAFLFPEQI